MADNLRLLVADNNPEHQKKISSLLEGSGYRLEYAADGGIALRMITQTRYDLVVMDLMGPEIRSNRGVEILRIIREFYNEADLPIVFFTENLSNEHVLEILRNGASDYLCKSTDYSILRQKVQNHLKLKELYRKKYSHSRASKLKSVPEYRQSTGAQKKNITQSDTFAGRYELQEKVGSGSFGTVYSAIDLKSKRRKKVAVKILQAQLDPNSADFQRFQREGIAMSRVQHPNAVAVSDFGVSPEGNAFLVMELLEGKTLSQILREAGRIPVSKVMHVLLPICSVLSKAHGLGMIHRDIKTENIFIQRKGSQELVKLLDFGIARIVAGHRLSNNLTMEEIEFGTPAYMAPERFKNEPYDSKIDVYSLGVVFYELLCGRLPFIPHDNSPMSMAMMHLQSAPIPPIDLVPSISPRMNSLILQILNKDPRQRPSVDMIAQEIAHMVGVDIDMYTYLTPGSRQVHESFYEDLATSLRRITEERLRTEIS